MTTKRNWCNSIKESGKHLLLSVILKESVYLVVFILKCPSLKKMKNYNQEFILEPIGVIIV